LKASMKQSIEEWFGPMSDMLNFSQQFAKGAETMARVNAKDIEVGTSEKTLVAEFDKVKLYHYKTLVKDKPKTDPVLIVYGLVGRYTMIDLQEDRSLVRNLLLRGVDLYVVDWGYASRADQYLNFDDYVAYYLDECVDAICRENTIDSINLFGICEGGVFTALYAAQNPEKVSNLVVSITPIDFAADQEDDDPSHGFINLWMRNLDAEDIEAMIAAYGNLPGEVMGSVFQAMTPVKSMVKYNLDFIDIAADDSKLLNFLRMEKWLADRPHHPGAAAKQWLIDLYKNNLLVKGEFVLAGEKVNLQTITMPVLNVYAERDHIVPPPCSKALKKYVGSKDYTELALPSGHVGIYVSSRLQGVVSDNIFTWLSKRQSAVR
jgi:polyhydroxyalkanoate synthase